MAMVEKFNTGQEVSLANPQRAWSYADQRGHLWVNRVASTLSQRLPVCPSYERTSLDCPCWSGSCQ